MGQSIVVPGNGWTSNLPRQRDVIQGFDAAGLIGLWPFTDGTVNAAHPGSYKDVSGLKHHLIKHGGGNPTQRTGYLETPEAGFIARSPFAFPSILTLILCAEARPADAGPLSNHFLFWAASTGVVIPADLVAGSWNNAATVGLNQDVVGTGSASSSELGFYSQPWTDASGTRKILAGGYGDALVPWVAALQINVATGKIRLTAITGDYIEFTDATRLNGLFTGHNLTIGAWPNGTLYECQGRLYYGAAWNTWLDDTALVENMDNMRSIVVGRGFTVAG